MLKNNIIANFLGTGYGMVLQFVMLPVTLHYLGPQAYGLIGIYATVLAILAVLDLGLSPALFRELARLSVLPDGKNLMRSTVTTLEIICFGIAFSIGVLIWFGAPLLAKYWFTNSSLPEHLVSNCLQWLGVQTALQFLTTYYGGGLGGLQRIVLSNYIAAATQTIRTAGLFWLLLNHPNIETYFIYQTATSLVILIVTGYALYYILPKDEKLDSSQRKGHTTLALFQKLTNRYNHERFMACRRFAAGMALTTLSTLALTQLDKVILSKMLSLEDFGYYTIAGSIAALLSKPALLVFGAALPRMTQLVASGDSTTLSSVYLKSASLVSWIVLPAAGILVGFSEPLLTLYLRDAKIVSHVVPIISLLAVGTALHATMYVPYGLTLAYGWTKFGINICLASSVVLIPLIIYGTWNYQAIGAASAWLFLSLLYVFVFSYYIHRHCLKGQLINFYKRVIFVQIIVMTVTIFLGINLTNWLTISH
jgi:O-antigen/teichoic acid export membrane protein